MFCLTKVFSTRKRPTVERLWEAPETRNANWVWPWTLDGSKMLKVPKSWESRCTELEEGLGVLHEVLRVRGGSRCTESADWPTWTKRCIQPSNWTMTQPPCLGISIDVSLENGSIKLPSSNAMITADTWRSSTGVAMDPSNYSTVQMDGKKNCRGHLHPQ